MARNKRKKTTLNRKQKIANSTLAILLLLFGLWLLPLAGSYFRPYLTIPEVVTLASQPKGEYEEIESQLKNWQIDDATINYLVEMQQKKTDAFVYPRLGIYSPLLVNDRDPTAIKDWKAIRDNLRQGVSASFGKKETNHSTLYLIGHSSDYDIFNQYASIFAPLGQAKPGDRAILMRGSNFTLVQIVDSNTILPNEIEEFESFGQPLIQGRDQIVLVTCWPVLTTRSRLLVRGIVESNFIAE